MSNVEFETDVDQMPSRFSAQKQNALGQEKYGGSLTNLFIKKGFIKDESQAKGVLIGIIIFNLLLSSFVVYFFVL